MEVKEFELPDGSKVSVPEEKWELINEYTVDENCISLTIDKDSHGQNFNLKKIMVRAKFLPSGNTAANYVASIKLDSENSGQINLGIMPNDTQIAGYVSLQAEINNGLFMVIDQRKGFNTTSVANAMIYSYQTDYRLSDDLIIYGIQKIDMVQITAIAQTIGKGSKIKIWGVRA